MKKFLSLLPLVTAFFVYAQQSIKIPPNKDTVVVTAQTTATTTTTTTFSTVTIPVNPPDPPPSGGGEISLSFEKETAYYERDFAGVEDWNQQNTCPIPANNPQQRHDLYWRGLWTQFEGPTQGSYNWTVFNQWINTAIQKRQRFSFGIFAVCPGGCDPFNGPVFYDGASSGYPLYIHQQMQTQSVKDWKTASTWIPNWNSSFMLDRLQALYNALAVHINNTTFNGVRYKDVVNYIDVRFYGSWGEWHNAGIVDNMSQYPAGMRPTVSTYRRIIDIHLNAFPNNQLAMLLAALDAERLNHTLTPVEVTNYALTVRNNVGPLGIRGDQRGSLQWNDAGNYVRQYMENNNKSWASGPLFSTMTMSRWQTAPLIGEPENNNDNPQLPTLLAQANFYRYNNVGNGNYKRSTASDNNMRTAAAAMGYRLTLTGGKIIYNSSGVTVSLNWRNIGLTPVYENWVTTIDIVNSSGTVVRTTESVFKARLFLPAANAQTFEDRLNSVPAGSYTVKLTIKDPTGYRLPLQLDIKGRNADGSYNLGSFTLPSQ